MKMLMDARYIRRRRVAFAVAVVAVGFALYGAMFALDHLNWVGDGYCFKSSLECYFPNE
jgi:uncharacterized membrane protein